MSSIDKNVLVPIPENAYVSKTTAEVFLIQESVYHPEKGYCTNKKKVIGRAVSSKEMYPNTYFKLTYPEIFNEHTLDKSESIIPHLSYGLYAAVLGVGTETGLYPILVECFGPEKANAVMDYAMYSALTQSNVTKDFLASMKNQMLFSEKPRNDTWYSELFKTGISDEQALKFQEKWIAHCAEKGTTDFWISLDGSNAQCSSENNLLNENGHPKPGNSDDLISYSVVVNSQNSMPISWDVYRGGRVDVKAAEVLIDRVRKNGIRCSGVIVDRGYCDDACLKMITERGYEYVLMLKTGCKGYDDAVSTYAQKIKNNVKYALDRKGYYGITEEEKLPLFTSRSSSKAYVHLYYDNTNGPQIQNTLVWGVKDAVKAANTKSAGMNTDSQENVQAELKYQKYIMKEDRNGQFYFHIDTDRLQEAVDLKGISAIATSTKMDANEADKIYHLRQSSEKEFSHLKSQLGQDAMRVQSTDGWLGKFCVGFISLIIRTALQNICVANGMDTNQMIRELTLMGMILDSERHYVVYHSENKRQIALLNGAGVTRPMLEGFAVEMNSRIAQPIQHPVHTLPVVPTKKSGRGRKKGSKNLKTIAKEQSVATGVKKGPGRPKGSRNRKSADITVEAIIS